MRNLMGRILTRFEDAGLKIIGMKLVQADEDLAGKHYGKDITERYGEKIRNLLLHHIKEGPVLAMVLEGAAGISTVRKLVGPTYPSEAPAGTIRGDFAHVSKDYANKKGISVKNLIHASADSEDAKLEIGLWFTDEELYSYKTAHDIHCLDE